MRRGAGEFAPVGNAEGPGECGGSNEARHSSFRSPGGPAGGRRGLGGVVPKRRHGQPYAIRDDIPDAVAAPLASKLGALRTKLF